TASSEPPGPQPVAPGTANVSSPWTAPVIRSAPSGPVTSGAPVAASKLKKPPTLSALERSLFCGFNRIGSCSEPMKQLGPSVGLFAKRILTGTVMIGAPVTIPAIRSKFDGAPADSVIAVTGPTGVLSCTGSATSDPDGDPPGMTVNVPLMSTSPVCRFVFPVVVVMLPIVMLP